MGHPDRVLTQGSGGPLLDLDRRNARDLPHRVHQLDRECDRASFRVQRLATLRPQICGAVGDPPVRRVEVDRPTHGVPGVADPAARATCGGLQGAGQRPAQNPQRDVVRSLGVTDHPLPLDQQVTRRGGLELGSELPVEHELCVHRQVGRCRDLQVAALRGHRHVPRRHPPVDQVGCRTRKEELPTLGLSRIGEVDGPGRHLPGKRCHEDHELQRERDACHPPTGSDSRCPSALAG